MSDQSQEENQDTLKSPETATEDVATKLATELEQIKKDYLYLNADFDNYKKQAIKERSELLRFGAERFIREFLDIADNFERALASEVNSENLSTFVNGVQIIQREIQALLAKHGVREVDPLGQPFDPSSHEALTSETSDQYQPGMISRVFKKAYKYHDRLIRPAQVVVAKANSETAGSQGEG